MPLGETVGSIRSPCMCSVGPRRVGHREARCLKALEDKAYGHRALADCCGDALHRATADIANAEDAGPARLKHKRHPIHPVVVVRWEVCAGEQKPVPVFGELAAEPLRAGIGPDEDEQRADRDRGCFLIAVVSRAGAAARQLTPRARWVRRRRRRPSRAGNARHDARQLRIMIAPQRASTDRIRAGWLGEEAKPRETG
jgi:hypothetical protein